MATQGKIEIVENTLLKLLIRRGINSDRLNVVFNEGELAYTTDTQKLFIGDGSTVGGILVTGTKFLGESADLTTLSPGDLKDLGFDSGKQRLYYISNGDGSNAGDWTPISNLVYSKDGTIAVDSDSGVKLGDAAGAGLTKDGNNKLEIGSSIATDNISKKTQAYLSMPQETSFGNVNYKWPAGGSVNSYLRYNSNGVLTWETIGGTSTTFVNEEIFPVGTIVPYADSSLPAGNKYLQCDGTYISTVSYPELSAVLQSTYGPLSTNANDGIQYFKLPDLRGKTALGFTNATVYDADGNGTTFALATSGGLYEKVLTDVNIPDHRHFIAADINVVSTGTLTALNQMAKSNEGVTSNKAYNFAGTSTAATLGRTSSWGETSPTEITIQSPYLAINYIIKALPDAIADCTIVIEDSLTASEVSQGTVFQINPLSGVYTIGLESQIEAQDVGYLTVNSKGLVTDFDSTSAGVVNNIGSQNTPVTHEFGFINFLETPVPIASVSLFGGVPNEWSQQVNVFPRLSSSIVGPLAVPDVNIPSTAKNIIVQATSGGFYNPQYYYAATHLDNLGSGQTRGAKEYLMNYNQYGGMQTILPLSAHPTDGTVSFAMRGKTPTAVLADVEIVGWTM